MSVHPGRLRVRSADIHPMLRNAADEGIAVAARIAAYVSALGLLAALAVQVWDQIPHGPAAPASNAPAWVASVRPMPAFALSQFDFGGRTETYDILRHPLGGRKDVIRWAAPGEAPAAEIEIYRPGEEAGQEGPPAAAVAARMDPGGTRAVETAGFVESKFGPVMLFDLSGRDADAHPCMGFLRVVAESDARISGFLCLGDAAPAQRAAIGCMLDRLMLLGAGLDSRLAGVFAQAELKRRACMPANTALKPVNWLAGVDNPSLRGSF